MTDWTAGYVADIAYTYGYYLELNPLRAQLAFLNAGLAPPESGVHCELGFGQGLSTNIHAASSTGTWYGTDFNPAQAAYARELAQASGASAHLTDEAFEDFCQRSDLPDFDSIGLHGIWSWINDANRAVIVDFVRRKLKVGGVLYISYNTHPGWATFAPMRHLWTEHAKTMSAPGDGRVKQVDGALAFTEKFLAADPSYAKSNPQVIERTKKVNEQDRSYLAHEYFNRDWQPMHFADMAKWLEPAKLGFACSAHYLDQIDAINLTADQQALLNEISDPMFRQTVRDFVVNQQFRKDYWVKGGRKLNPLEQAEGFRAQRVMLMQPRADIKPKVTGSIGEATLQDAVYLPILDFLADHKTKTLGQIEDAVKTQGVALAQITQAVMILAGAGHLATVQDKGIALKARRQTDKLNAHLIDKARGSPNIAYLASPVTGGGAGMNRFQQLFLLAISEGKERPKDWAQSVWQILQSQGQKIVKEGKTLETPEENLEELKTQADTFAKKMLPILKALQIA